MWRWGKAAEMAWDRGAELKSARIPSLVADCSGTVYFLFFFPLARCRIRGGAIRSDERN